MKRLLKLTASIYNTPHLITPQAFNVVLDYLSARNAGKAALDIYEEDMLPLDDIIEEPKFSNGMGVLRVDGSLTYKPLMTMCGEVGTSYCSLVEQAEEMAGAGVKTIVMEVSSGGGESSHCFQAAEEIRAICDEYSIKLLGYADTMACSAAYALISICDEVVMNPSAEAGSIGCVCALMDTSKAMEQAGLKRIFITSGDNKVPFDGDGTFKKEFLDQLQEHVDKLNLEFATHVSNYTGLSVEEIIAFEAKTFNAEDAVKVGLANKIMTNKQFAAYAAEVHQGAKYA